ncbi:MAG: septum formation initiator family protein [Clostridia bacterium]|nr:septum formation initiator family protein [Clostridia bacterium]
MGKSKFRSMVKLITVCATCLLVVLVAVIFGQQIALKNMASKQSELNAELASLENRRVSLENGIDTRISEDYIERQAREQLGMIKKGEIIYIYN